MGSGCVDDYRTHNRDLDGRGPTVVGHFDSLTGFDE